MAVSVENEETGIEVIVVSTAKITHQ